MQWSEYRWSGVAINGAMALGRSGVWASRRHGVTTQWCRGETALGAERRAGRRCGESAGATAPKNPRKPSCRSDGRRDTCCHSAWRRNTREARRRGGRAGLNARRSDGQREGSQRQASRHPDARCHSALRRDGHSSEDPRCSPQRLPTPDVEAPRQPLLAPQRPPRRRRCAGTRRRRRAEGRCSVDSRTGSTYKKAAT